MNTSIRTYFLFLLLGLSIPLQTSCATENDNALKDTATETSQVEQDKLEKAKINPWRLAAKMAVGTAVSLYAHYLLEYITVCAHEHGHGLAGGDPNYTIAVNPTSNPIQPWHGVCMGGVSSFFSIAAGPLAGLCATYLQCITIETLKGYMQGKSLKESAQHGLRHPFLFFSKAKQTAKIYCSSALNKKSDKEISEPSWSSVVLNSLMLLRCGRMTGESIYGLMPYRYEAGQGDGERLWKMIFGDNCPTFKANLPALTLMIMYIPYAMGALEAWRLENKDKNLENTTA